MKLTVVVSNDCHKVIKTEFSPLRCVGNAVVV
jgi:hypothetical protein